MLRTVALQGNNVGIIHRWYERIQQVLVVLLKLVQSYLGGNYWDGLCPAIMVLEEIMLGKSLIRSLLFLE